MVNKQRVPQPRPFFTPGKHSEPRDTGSAEFAPISLTWHPTGVAHLQGPFRAREPAPSPRSPRQPHSSAPLPPRLPGTEGNFPSAGATDTPGPRLLTSAQQRAQHKAQRPTQWRHRPGGRALGAHPASRQLRPSAARPGRSARSRPPPAVPCPGATPGSESAGRAEEPVVAPRRCRVQAAAAPDPAAASALAGTTFLQPPRRPRARPVPRAAHTTPPTPGPRPWARPWPEAGERCRGESGSWRAEEEVRRGGSKVAPMRSPLLPAASRLRGLWLESRRVLRRYPRLKMEPSPSPRPPPGVLTLHTSTSGRTLILCLLSRGHLELSPPQLMRRDLPERLFSGEKQHAEQIQEESQSTEGRL